ncbi:MAG: HEPN domain-containing protein [Oscillospiraceae bacterium]|nr:HEPN domain-containing protein [Oscillospiraceae bacterium]
MGNHRLELSKYRLDEAERCIDSAKLLYDAGDFKSAVNRSYYCVHNAMRSVFALQGKDFKKHSALMTFFRGDYIKTKVFSDKMSDILRDLFFIRNKSDYEDFYIVGKQETSEQIDNARHFLEQIKLYLSNQS